MIAKNQPVLDRTVTWGDNVRPVNPEETRAVLSRFYASAAADTGEDDRYVPAEYEPGLGDIAAEQKNRKKFRLPRGTDKALFVIVQMALGQNVTEVSEMLGWRRKDVAGMFDWASARGRFDLRQLRADVKGMNREEVERYIAQRCQFSRETVQRPVAKNQGRRTPVTV